jgi:hypothetical protein
MLKNFSKSEGLAAFASEGVNYFSQGKGGKKQGYCEGFQVIVGRGFQDAPGQQDDTIGNHRSRHPGKEKDFAGYITVFTNGPSSQGFSAYTSANPLTDEKISPILQFMDQKNQAEKT